MEVPIFEERYRENVVDEHRTLSVDDEEKEAALRFLHLPDSERTTIDALLRGRQPASASLREPASRVVRVFVSASFTGERRVNASNDKHHGCPIANEF